MIDNIVVCTLENWVSIPSLTLHWPMWLVLNYALFAVLFVFSSLLSLGVLFFIVKLNNNEVTHDAFHVLCYVEDNGSGHTMHLQQASIVEDYASQKAGKNSWNKYFDIDKCESDLMFVFKF